MTQSLSKWRAEARREIEALLATLPPAATRKDAAKALRTIAHRWGAEDGGWVYQCWLKERKRALSRRWPDPKAEPPRVTITTGGVACGWCEKNGPCIVCARARAFLIGLSAEGRSLLAAAEEEPAVLGVWFDWLEQEGLGEWRTYWNA